jgi:hypothetical protein
VIKALDPIGFGPKVMQSNNDFGVAATFSVNAHALDVPLRFAARSFAKSRLLPRLGAPR